MRSFALIVILLFSSCFALAQSQIDWRWDYTATQTVLTADWLTASQDGGAYLVKNGFSNGFVRRIAPNGTTAWSTHLGKFSTPGSSFLIDEPSGKAYFVSVAVGGWKTVSIDLSDGTVQYARIVPSTVAGSTNPTLAIDSNSRLVILARLSFDIDALTINDVGGIIYGHRFLNVVNSESVEIVSAGFGRVAVLTLSGSTRKLSFLDLDNHVTAFQKTYSTSIDVYADHVIQNNTGNAVVGHRIPDQGQFQIKVHDASGNVVLTSMPFNSETSFGEPFQQTGQNEVAYVTKPIDYQAQFIDLMTGAVSNVISYPSLSSQDRPVFRGDRAFAARQNTIRVFDKYSGQFLHTISSAWSNNLSCSQSKPNHFVVQSANRYDVGMIDSTDTGFSFQVPCVTEVPGPDPCRVVPLSDGCLIYSDRWRRYSSAGALLWQGPDEEVRLNNMFETVAVDEATDSLFYLRYADSVLQRRTLSSGEASWIRAGVAEGSLNMFGGELRVIDWAGGVFRLNPVTGATIGSAAAMFWLNSVCFDQDGNIYVYSRSPGSGSRFEKFRSDLLRLFSVPVALAHISSKWFAPASDRLYVYDAGGGVNDVNLYSSTTGLHLGSTSLSKNVPKRGKFKSGVIIGDFAYKAYDLIPTFGNFRKQTGLLKQNLATGQVVWNYQDPPTSRWSVESVSVSVTPYDVFVLLKGEVDIVRRFNPVWGNIKEQIPFTSLDNAVFQASIGSKYYLQTTESGVPERNIPSVSQYSVAGSR